MPHVFWQKVKLLCVIAQNPESYSRVLLFVVLQICNIKVCSNNQCIVFSILMFLTTGT